MIKHCYIHIPFCNQICSYCDFCKLYYNKDLVTKYLKALEKEISSIYDDSELETIYIGGGTPSSLSLEELEELLNILSKLKKAKNVEYTIEGNFESTTREKLKLYKKYGINRLSFGLETIDKNNLKILERECSKGQVKKTIQTARNLGFHNINVDLMYALPNEALTTLEKDLDFLIELDVEHISTYSLIIEEHTKLGIQKIENISEDLDSDMYELICKKLKENNYDHYEISNFSRKGMESKHNLSYWENAEYFGFGLGASSYLQNQRITNTRSINNYIQGKYRKEIETVTEKEKMEYEVILALRKKEGLDLKKFQKQYHRSLQDVYDYSKLVKEKFLSKEGNNLFIPENKWYISNEILIEILEGEKMDKEKLFSTELSYLKIDKIRKACLTVLNLLPDYFFEIPAASTGKYHPEYAQGEGGLLRHSKAAMRIGYELLSDPLIGDKYTEKERDLMLMALLIHDGLKCGNPKEKYTRFDHPILMADFLMDNEEELGLEVEEIEFLCDVIKTHMGIWTKDYNGVEVLEKPKTKYQNFVHMCDYLASRKCLLLPFDNDNNISV